jgi:hypothetical protein
MLARKPITLPNNAVQRPAGFAVGMQPSVSGEAVVLAGRR